MIDQQPKEVNSSETELETGSSDQLRPTSGLSDSSDVPTEMISPKLSGYHTLYVTGNLRSAAYHRAAAIVTKLAQDHLKYVACRLHSMVPMEWELYVSEHASKTFPVTVKQGVVVQYAFHPQARVLEETTVADIEQSHGYFEYRHELKRKHVSPISSPTEPTSPARLPERKLIGTTPDLLKYVGKSFGGSSTKDESEEFWATVAKEKWQEWMKTSGHGFAKFSIQIGEDVPVGDLIFELFLDTCPKTCENFKQLVSGQGSVKNQTYKGTNFHRLVSNGWIQGGDLSNAKGKQNVSATENVFEDENYIIPHLHRGILSMSNSGPHTNGSQFFITLKEMSCFDKNYVAFGRIVDGNSILKAMEQVPTVYPECPAKPIGIVDCEILAL